MCWCVQMHSEGQVQEAGEETGRAGWDQIMKDSVCYAKGWYLIFKVMRNRGLK